MELWQHVRLILGENLIAAEENGGLVVRYIDDAAKDAALQCEDMTVRFAATFTDSFSEDELRELFRIFINRTYGEK